MESGTRFETAAVSATIKFLPDNAGEDFKRHHCSGDYKCVNGRYSPAVEGLGILRVNQSFGTPGRRSLRVLRRRVWEAAPHRDVWNAERQQGNVFCEHGRSLWLRCHTDAHCAPLRFCADFTRNFGR